MIRSALFSLAFLWPLLYQTEAKMQVHPQSMLVRFVAIDNLTRAQIAEAISNLSVCAPKVIALDLVFETLTDVKVDSTLARVIREAGNVVMAIELDSGNQMVRSHSTFTSEALGEGVNSYFHGDDSVVTDYIPLFENESRQALSFAGVVAYQFMPTYRNQIQNMRVNRPKNVVLSSDKDDFLIIPSDQIKCDQIRNKIVILTAVDEDCCYVRMRNKKRPVRVGTGVMAANIILELLK